MSCEDGNWTIRMHFSSFITYISEIFDFRSTLKWSVNVTKLWVIIYPNPEQNHIDQQKMPNVIEQGSATLGTRANDGTPDGIGWHTARFWEIFFQY